VLDVKIRQGDTIESGCEEVLDVKIRQGYTIESGCEEVLDVKIRQSYTIESGYFRILPMFKDFFVVCTTLDIYVFIHR
jgi:hypothetical protein